VLAAWLADLAAVIHQHIADLSAAELLDYLGQVTDRLLQALDGMPTEVLHAPHPAWAPPAAATRY
jgi:hypothetical protein